MRPNLGSVVLLRRRAILAREAAHRPLLVVLRPVSSMSLVSTAALGRRKRPLEIGSRHRPCVSSKPRSYETRSKST